MAVMEGMTGIVVGAVFGGIFVLTCFISSVKAIRDRRRIKRKIAERGEARASAGDIEEKQSESTLNGVTTTCPSGPAVICGPSMTIPAFSVKDGVDNMTFKHSHVDIKHTAESNRRHSSSSRSKLNKAAEPELSHNSSVPKRTLSDDARGERDRRLRHLSQDCLAVKKTMRRYSYEIAVAEHSWLPLEPANFASSETIMNTYKYGSTPGANTKTSTVGFENKAYDEEDCKNKMAMCKL